MGQVLTVANDGYVAINLIALARVDRLQVALSGHRWSIRERPHPAAS